MIIIPEDVTKREPTEKEREKLENNFSYHSPKGDQNKRYELIRHGAKQLCWVLLRLCPESRELSLAITALEEAVMWANASIARSEK